MTRIASYLLMFSAVGCSDPNAPQPPYDIVDSTAGETGTPDIEVEPSIISFGTRPPGCPSDEVEVVVHNRGDGALEIADINGPGAAQFSSSFPDLGQPTLLPGDSVSFWVDFEADSFGDFTGVIEIESNDPEEPTATVELDGRGGDQPMGVDVFEPRASDATDVLWVVDNSCSMGDVVDQLRNGLDTFLETLSTHSVDYQLGVVTTDMSTPGHQGQLRGGGVMSRDVQGGDDLVVEAFTLATTFGTNGSADERGRDAAYAALSAPLVDGDNAGLVRADANLAVIIVSDEEDGSDGISTADFVTFIDNYKGDPDLTSVSGIVGPEISSGIGIFPGFSCAFTGAGSAEATQHYPDVIHATDGQLFDLCDVHFDEAMEQLGTEAAGLQYRFCLQEEVVSPAGITVEVDGAVLSRVSGPPVWTEGWNITVEGCIKFYGSSVPGDGSVVRISYPIEAQCD